MKTLSIETSCDETAVSLIEYADTQKEISILADITASQTKLHEQYGGVYPMMARREHEKNLPHIIEQILAQTTQKRVEKITFDEALIADIKIILTKEEGLVESLIALAQTFEKPSNYIAVTYGPGLEPALWVGLNTAKVLAMLWNIPLIPVNHMEGHIIAGTAVRNENKITLKPMAYPTIALLISGGHTELVLLTKPNEYTIIGETRDDAVGEAYDKVARMLSLPYPGGPQISKLADEAREGAPYTPFSFPRPMLASGDYDFSFSGLKTHILYAIKKHGELTEESKRGIALEFENTTAQVLVTKMVNAGIEYNAKNFVVGGGVSANNHIRKELQKAYANQPDVTVHLPAQNLTTDNALMIALASIGKSGMTPSSHDGLRAQGNLHFERK